jgi:hypothetical protein
MAGSDLQLATEIVALRRENRRLRYRAEANADARKQARHRRIVELAKADAELLIGWALALQPISRAETPLSQQRWARAVALLRLARLAPRNGRVRIYGVQPPIMIARLAKATETAIGDPSALALFTAKGRRNGQRRTATVRKAGDRPQPNPVKPGVGERSEWGRVALG